MITEDGNVSKRGFVMSHYSRFIRPGSYRVRGESTPTSGVSVSSYQNGTNLITVVINQNASSRTITLNYSGSNVRNITQYETTGTTGHNATVVGNHTGGASLVVSLAGYSISTFVGTIGDGGSGLSGTYQLKNRGTSMYLDGMGRTENGANVGMWNNTSHNNSQWTIEPYDGLYYRVKNRATGLFLDGMGRTSNGSICGQYASTSHQNAQWELISVSELRSAKDSDSEAIAEVLSKTASVSVFPNPVRDWLSLSLQENSENTVIKLYNSKGQLVKSEVLSGKENQMNLSGLSGGVYVLEVIPSSGRVEHIRIMKE